MTYVENSSPQTIEARPYFRMSIGNWEVAIRRDVFHDGAWAIGVMTACAAAGWLLGAGYRRDR